jgi:hypothetical protein
MLAKIRNPWSKEGYIGEWSDNDPRWTSDLLAKVGHTKGSDGVFFMPFHKFYRKPYFDDSAVAMYNDFTASKIYYIT